VTIQPLFCRAIAQDKQKPAGHRCLPRENPGFRRVETAGQYRPPMVAIVCDEVVSSAAAACGITRAACQPPFPSLTQRLAAVAQLQQLPQAPDAVLVGDAGGHDGRGRDSDETVCQLTAEPADPPLSSDRGPGCRTVPAAPTGSAPDAVLVGDAGGHDGTGRDPDESSASVSR
jgi:hypothetical protein